MKIALIDSGVELGHRYFTNATIKSVDLLINDNIYDENGHGSSSAGEILCINPNAEIISLKILNKENITNVKALVIALDYCLNRHDIGIINMSLTCRIDDAEIEHILTSIIDRLILNNVMIFCSEPNCKYNGKYIHDLHGVYAVSAIYNSHCDECVIDKTNEQVIYSGSNFLRPSIKDDYTLFRGNSSYTVSVKQDRV